MRAIGYVRVSSEEQRESGLSLTGQEERIRAFCVAKEWDLAEVVIDGGYTGSNTNRPGLQRILAQIRRGEVDVLVVLKLDRLTRSVKDLGFLLEELERRHVAFSSVTDNFDTSTANGRLVMNLLASVAQWERDVIAERTKDALRVKRSQGRRFGEVPFGFTLAPDGDTLEPDAEEFAVVETMRTMRGEGLSLRKIAARLNADGIASKKGGRWQAETVRSVLASDLYNAGGDVTWQTN